VHGADIAYAEGTYSGKAPNAGGAEEQGHGNWVVTLKNSNGKWLLATHTSVPAAGMKGMVKP
jgi:ketosteroid isomerase-like protein